MLKLFVFIKKIIFIFFLLCASYPYFGEENLSEKVWRKKNLEDFEKITLSGKNLRVSGNQDIFPEVRMSKNLTAPIPDTTRSLLLRFPPTGNDFPVEIYFDKPIEIKEFVKEFTFHVYSSGNGARLFFYLMDVKANIIKVFLTNLSFQGWQAIRVGVDTRFEQNDLVLNFPSKVFFTGFLIEPREKILKDKEDLLAIDDIFVTVREKYKIIKKLDQMIE